MSIEDYGAALSYYEMAIGEGSQDPELYYSAAQAAQRQGAFGKAERYFSQSLRYGGGVEVARGLAEFYIQTSNFSQAVQVFQYLMRYEEDVQPVYSNIGTALMYSGHYMDAESYLLIAQQMDPADTVPYINLGVLYDRHLRNWPRAVRFYECYVEMSSDASQTRTVRTRLQEIENTRAVDTSRVGLSCGDTYAAKEPEKRDLREELGVADTGGPLDVSGAPIDVDGINLDLPLVYQPDSANGGGETEVREIEVVHRERDTASETGGAQVLAEDDWSIEAHDAFEAGRYDEVVELLSELSDEEADVSSKALLGKSLFQVGRFEESAEVLEEVLSERPTPELADRIINAYQRAGDREGVQRICDRFSDWPDYEEALSECDA